jgi:hypothetical protein
MDHLFPFESGYFQMAIIEPNKLGIKLDFPPFA